MHPLSWIDFLPRFLMQLGSIWEPNLGLCWRLFRDLLPLESRTYLEVILASFFLRFLTPLKDRKPSFRIVNNMVSYTSAFLPWTLFLDRSWTQNDSNIEPKRLQNSIRYEVENLSNFEVDFECNLASTWPQDGHQKTRFSAC